MSDTFTAGEVCAATGATYRQLDSWLREGYLEMEKPFPGSGHNRSFTFKEALQVAVMVEVSNTGVYPKRVHPAQVIRDSGVYRKEWSTFTLDINGLTLGLMHKLGLEPKEN